MYHVFLICNHQCADISSLTSMIKELNLINAIKYQNFCQQYGEYAQCVAEVESRGDAHKFNFINFFFVYSFFCVKLYNIIFIFDYFFSATNENSFQVYESHTYVYDHKQGSIYSLPLYEPYFEVLLTIFISSEFCSFNKAF